MYNELIKNARTIADSIHVHSSFQDWEAAEKDTLEKCAEALETAEQRIAKLEKQHRNQLTRNIMLTAQLPREGEWIWENYCWHCSVCGKNPTRGMGYVQGKNELFKVCPNCGARMKKK